MQSVADVASPMPRPAEFYAVNRGGGLYSEAFSQRVGALFAYAAYRLGVSPTMLTLANLTLGVSASVCVVVLAPHAAAGSVPAWTLGVVALVGWQVAYAFDCADGQLARVTGRTSRSGARLDVLCDVASQIAIVGALASVAVAYRPSTATWLVAAFAGTWMVNLVTSVMQSGPNAASMVPSRAPLVRTVKLVRDFGAVVLLAGLVLTLIPQWTIVLLWVFTVVNGGFLVASIAFTARPHA